MKHLAKNFVERGAILSGAARAMRYRKRHNTLVLAYHNIVPHGEHPVGDRSLHLSQTQFADQLDRLLETHDIVDARELLAPSENEAPSRPRAVITFDDAYRGAVWAGVEELQTRNLPATIFVPPAFLDGGTFWWDAIASDDDLAPELRTRALEEHRGFTPAVLAWATANRIPYATMPQHATCASLEELQSALTHDKLTLGAHTWNHPNLVLLSADELAFELGASLDWLAQFGDRAVHHITYPYGHNNIATWDAARKARYKAGYRIDGGWMPPVVGNVFAIPRLNIPAGVSDAGFVLRISGMLS